MARCECEHLGHGEDGCARFEDIDQLIPVWQRGSRGEDLYCVCQPCAEEREHVTKKDVVRGILALRSLERKALA